jgi:hypothetical protein
MITINNRIPMIGEVVTLGEEDIIGWDDLPNDQSTCPFVIHYGTLSYEGVVDLSQPSEITLVFEQHVTLPSKLCITLLCDCDNEVVDGCVDNDITSITRDTRLMAVGDDGCPIGHFTVGQILDLVISEVDIPGNICELIGGNIHVGTYVAGDYILTVNGCAIKAIPGSEVICP